MTDEQIIEELNRRLNESGRSFGVSFQVSSIARPDGEWTQFFVRVSDGGRRAAARQIISDVEADLSEEAGREILVLPTRADAAQNVSRVSGPFVGVPLR